MLKISKEENFIQQHQVARQLVRGVAHEIKNPLAGIRGATQLLARSLNDPKYDEFTDIIISEVDRLRNSASIPCSVHANYQAMNWSIFTSLLNGYEA